MDNWKKYYSDSYIVVIYGLLTFTLKKKESLNIFYYGENIIQQKIIIYKHMIRSLVGYKIP